MIFSRRKPTGTGETVPIIIPKGAANARSVDPAEDRMDAWRKRTDTDGTERRARQTKRDNELL